ncbi:hypothetical protein BOTBODRAFT_169263 [Botryobasidium botryosum FD-172 SS1]|uniref:Uncharacterized protein n=1 Tax=Botryobasidium botryosum (strain FD-172 SS1) TaxID=930990 RepID=A0A067N8Q6_BOTB1|nr:hypothetical protein BOTBODRAFT_169263 [Botryobasidium botryosum FD-172 SS1]
MGSQSQSQADKPPSQPPRDGDDLPTYEYLEAKESQSPNSRFGRWRQWIEKRAAERHLDAPQSPSGQRSREGSLTIETNVFPPTPTAESGPPDRRLALPPSYSATTMPKPTPVGEDMSPCHLSIHQFGSRFISHSSSPINTILPILSDKLILIGTREGLFVLDVLPSLHGGGQGFRLGQNAGLLDDARPRQIWSGEGVWQLAILESGATEEGDPRGVILALVDSPETNERDARCIRMYNLSSIVSLARWSVTQKESYCLDLFPPSTPVAASKRKNRVSLAKGFKALLLDPGPAVNSYATRSAPCLDFIAPPPGKESSRSPSPSPPALSRADTGSSWDLVDETALRWATDYVALAQPGSRLASSSPLFFQIHKSESFGGRGPVMLVIATKSSLLLYETPRGERAFRFVKEYYTPIPARTVTFVHQTHGDQSVARAFSMSTSPSQRRAEGWNPASRSSSDTFRASSRRSHLNLFVTFDKKAGLIRLGDSAVGEVELWDDGLADPVSPGSSSRRASSLDILGREKPAQWIPVGDIQIPIILSSSASTNATQTTSQRIYLLTKGSKTHILPSPLPNPLLAVPPLHILMWQTPPTRLVPRLVFPVADEPPVLQVIAFGANGVEAQEIPLSSLGGPKKGKGKAPAPSSEQPSRWATSEFGGDAYFGCVGGDWYNYPASGGSARLTRQNTVDSLDMAASSGDAEEGVYGWVRRGIDDWRVIWIGTRGGDKPLQV